MNRRNFMEASTILGATALFSPTKCKTQDKPQNVFDFKLGYQLYSVNEDMNKDPFKTLEALKAMGYQDFEIYGFDPTNVSYYTHPVADFKKRLEDMELTTTSGHYGFANYMDKSKDELRFFIDQCIKGAKVLNTPYITWPWMPDSRRNMETYKIMSAMLNDIGEQITAAGLGFAYHNHGFEFIDHDGETFYDIILQETEESLVKLQLDMYWSEHSSSLSPQEIIDKHPGRFVMWHIKDMDKVTRDYTELGNGSIDYVSLLPDPKVSGLEYYYLEQGGNFAHSAMKSAEDSAQYFKQKLQHIL